MKNPPLASLNERYWTLTPYVFFAVSRYCVSDSAASANIVSGICAACPPSGVVTGVVIHDGAFQAVAISLIPFAWSCCMYRNSL